MDTLQILLFVLQVLIAIVLIGFVLIQQGKGADAGAAFGSGSSATVFGSQGSASFLVKVTAVLAIIFFGNSLLLSHLAVERIEQAPRSLLDKPEVIVEEPETTAFQDIPVSPDSSSDSASGAFPGEGTVGETTETYDPTEQHAEEQRSDLPGLPRGE